MVYTQRVRILKKFQALKMTVLFSLSPTAIFIAFLIESTTGLSGTEPAFDLLYDSFNTFAHCLHRDISTTVSVFPVFKNFSFTASTASFLCSFSFTILADHRESGKCYPRACTKEVRGALLRMLPVFSMFCFSF